VTDSPLVAVVMGSKSDWPDTMKFVAETLDEFGVAHECRVLSAHRTPAETSAYATSPAWSPPTR
jgi:5-(carboxyamino)imidazole ribonucleotide mutase